jgi:hypothetical protein
MAGPLRIYVDTQNRRLVRSNTNASDVSFPNLIQGETPTVQLYFLDPTNGSQANPFSYVGLSGATLKLAIINGSPTGGADTAIANQETWSTISGGFSSTLNCATVGISNALGSGSSLSGTVEIEVTESGGTPVKYFQGAATIKSAVIDSSTNTPTPVSSYLTANEVNAGYLKFVNAPGVVVRFVSPSGVWARDIGVNDDGSGKDDIIQLI